MADFDERQENEQLPPDEVVDSTSDADETKELSLLDNFKILFGASADSGWSTR